MNRLRRTSLTMSLLLMATFSATASHGGFVPGGTLDPTTIPKFVEPLKIPPAMPKSGTLMEMNCKKTLFNDCAIDYYEIAARQISQQILPTGLPMTTVWGYGSANHPETFSYPAYTIEAKVDRPVRVKWINDLKNSDGTFIQHLLPIDQTLHWANPTNQCADGMVGTDCGGGNQLPYDGPVPTVTHLHGAHVGPDSDGYPEAWYLPAASDIPAGYATQGKRFDQIGGVPVEAGAAVFQYPNDQRATTLWYHDHTLGMSRANVYTGLAGFYLLRGGLEDLISLALPKPAPALGDPAGKKYYEIPIVIQDRSFNADGSLFYPGSRAFFEGLEPNQLKIPFTPYSDVAPIWNPEFFGNTLVVNGKTWPYLDVEQRRYRLRLLNGSNSRFLILQFDAPVSFVQIGADGGYLPKPVTQTQLLMAPAERADVIVDFSKIPAGTTITLLNQGPDEPFGGGVLGVDFTPSDPATTGEVMQFRVGQRVGRDLSFPPKNLLLPAPPKLGPVTNTRTVSLNEEESGAVRFSIDTFGNIIPDANGIPFGPTAAKLGTLDALGFSTPLKWMDKITENPAKNSVEVWEIYNFTADAHPIHLHQVQFEVLNRQALATDVDGMSVQPAVLAGVPTPPEAWEKGRKDTVIAYPGSLTRVKAKFDIPGLFVWHCHILEHEDNEMMRPFCVGTPGTDCPADMF